MTDPGYRIHLVLYVKGARSSSERALRNLRRAVGRREGIRIDVRDLVVEPLTPADDPIVGTPTLVMRVPRRAVIVGELEDVDRVRALLS